MDFSKKMKNLIKKSVDYEITGLCCYRGYKGGNIVKITATNEYDINRIFSYCFKNNIMIKENYDFNTKNFEIYCIFEQDDIYELKE